MWLVTTSIAAGGATILNFILPKRYKLGLLSLMLWGATVMIFIDHLLGYEGGAFLEKTTDGMIKDSVILGLAMLVPVFAIWAVSFLVSNSKRR
ncbi:MAG: hypothetical protein NC828_01505 [Candidatus Omnitrophica bacterium]|nr:hypothetical protein [Candidatus Omnitrophota bacterium]